MRTRFFLILFFCTVLTTTHAFAESGTLTCKGPFNFETIQWYDPAGFMSFLEIQFRPNRTSAISPKLNPGECGFLDNKGFEGDNTLESIYIKWGKYPGPPVKSSISFGSEGSAPIFKMNAGNSNYDSFFERLTGKNSDSIVFDVNRKDSTEWFEVTRIL